MCLGILGLYLCVVAGCSFAMVAPVAFHKHSPVVMLTQLCLQYLAGTDTGFRSSTTVVLKGVGNTLLEEDIRRIVRQKKHLTEFIGENDIERGA